MRKIWSDFKQFAFKGNVMDLAVGVMIGTAFSAIVTSLVNDLFMPVLSLFIGRIDFSALKITLGEGDAAAAIHYGSFLQAVVNFLLIAVCVFAFVKGIGLIERNKKEAPTPARLCPYCRQPIDDAATRCPHCTSQLT